MKNFKVFVSAAVACMGVQAMAQTINKAEGWLESAFVEWTHVSGASAYNVYYSGNGKTNVKVDAPLVRSYGNYMRVDIPGLKAGSYTVKVAPVVGGSEQSGVTTSALSVKAHDRAGFAFSNGRVPGAYNADGTLKSGAVVIYVTEKTKNTVTMDVTTSSKGATTTCKSFQGILNCYKKGYETRPLDLRFIGNVTDSDSLQAGDMMIDLGKSEKSYVTVEGVGADAVANGWGIRIKNAQNVEVSNLGFMNVNSSEGDNVSLQQTNEHIWVHNNDMFYGDAGSDADQAKGDGALDCKKSTYVTFSYNHFWDNGKSNLLGLSEGTTDGLYITYHHNWYDHSDSRHPRVRYYSAHVYNNYYDGNAKYGAGSTLGSSVFMESNYFRNCKYPMLTSMQGSDVYAGGTTRDTKNNPTFSSEAGGTIKAYNNYMEGSYTFIPYGASKYTLKGVETAVGSIDSKADFDAYVVNGRNEKVPNTVKSYDGANTYNNFDTDANVMYSYTVEEPAAAKASVVAYAGRVQGGDFKWSFTAADDEDYSVNKALKSALVAYQTSIKSIQGEGQIVIVETPASSSSSNPPASSSSSVDGPTSSSSSVEPPASCSSVEPGSSEDGGDNGGNNGGNNGGSISKIEGDVIHNFTQSGTQSEYFEIVGNLSTSKGSVTFDSETLTQCLKMESSTQIKFNLSKSSAMTLVLNGDFNGNIKVDGKNVEVKNGVVVVNLAAGDHSITKGDSSNLYLIVVKFDDGASAGDIPQMVSNTSPMAPAIRYNSAESRLEIGASDIRRLEIMGVDGGKVRLNDVGNSVDLSRFQSGVYFVRLVTPQKSYIQKIVKK